MACALSAQGYLYAHCLTPTAEPKINITRILNTLT